MLSGPTKYKWGFSVVWFQSSGFSEQGSSQLTRLNAFFFFFFKVQVYLCIPSPVLTTNYCFCDDLWGFFKHTSDPDVLERYSSLWQGQWKHIVASAGIELSAAYLEGYFWVLEGFCGAWGICLKQCVGNREGFNLLWGKISKYRLRILH